MLPEASLVLGNLWPFYQEVTGNGTTQIMSSEPLIFSN